MDIKDKVTFVTGGSGDIGSTIAKTLANKGVDVAISYVEHLEGANSTIEAIKTTGRRGLAIQLDQRDSASIDASVSAVINEFGRIDILVNNAGWNIGIPFPDLDSLTDNIWDRVLETNLRGPYLLSRAFAKHLREHGTGRIINIAKD